MRTASQQSPESAEKAPEATPISANLGRPRPGLLDLSPLQTLLTRIQNTYNPEQIWLFGSRARGDAGSDSDWDLLVVVPDTTHDDSLDLVTPWRLQKGSEVHADVIVCRATEFRDDFNTVNTIFYDVAREGMVIYCRLRVDVMLPIDYRSSLSVVITG